MLCCRNMDSIIYLKHVDHYTAHDRFNCKLTVVVAALTSFLLKAEDTLKQRTKCIIIELLCSVESKV